MRKLGFILLGLVVLIVIALFAASALVDVNRYRARIQAELQQRLGRPVELGTMHLKLLPPSFRVENVAIAEDPAFKTGRPFAQVPNFYVSARLLPLLSGKVELSALEFERPTVELVRDARGTWNFASLGKTTEPPAKPAAAEPAGNPPPGTPPAGSPPSAITLDHLRISDGQVAITDLQKHQARAAYDHIDLDLAHFAPDRPFDLTLAAHLPGAGRQTLRLQGSAGPLRTGEPLATPFHGALQLDQVAISSLQKFLNSEALRGIEATVSGKTNVTNAAGKLAADGSLRFDNAVLRGTAVGSPVSLDYQAGADLDQDLLRIEEGTLKVGATPLSLTGVINHKSDPAQLDVRLRAADVSLGEVARLAGALGLAVDPKTKVEGRLTADLSARGPATQPVLSGTARMPELKVTSAGSPPLEAHAVDLNLAANSTGTMTIAHLHYDQITLDNVHATVAIAHGVITLAPITADAFGGKEEGSIVADTRTTPITLQIGTNLQKADADQVLSAVSTLKQALAGVLGANGQARLALGATTADIARSLNGNLSLNLQPGRILKMDLLHEVASIGKFLNAGQAGQNFTNIVKMAGDFNLQNGVASTNNLKATIDGGTLAATGTANLVDQSLNLHLIAVLSQDYSRKVGGTSVGGFMQTALANNQGELVVPIVITGSFAAPRFAPDLQQMAQMKLQNLLPTSGNPGQLTSGILGAVLGGKKAGTTSTPSPAPNPADLLNQLLNRPKKEKPQPPPPPPQ